MEELVQFLASTARIEYVVLPLYARTLSALLGIAIMPQLLFIVLEGKLTGALRPVREISRIVLLGYSVAWLVVPMRTGSWFFDSGLGLLGLFVTIALYSRA